MRFPRVAVGAAVVLWAAAARAQETADAVDIRCDGRAGLTVTRASGDAPFTEQAPPGSSVVAVSVREPSPVRARIQCGTQASAPRTPPAAPRVHMAPLRRAGLALGSVTGAIASFFLALSFVAVLRDDCETGPSGTTCHASTHADRATPWVVGAAIMGAASAAGFLMLALGERVPSAPPPRATLWVAPSGGGASAGFGLRF